MSRLIDGSDYKASFTARTISEVEEVSDYLEIKNIRINLKLVVEDVY